MEMLAVKRTPKTWDEIMFQDRIVKTLKGAITKKSKPNVILLEGPVGLGKTSIARVYAASLACKDPQGVNPCGICETCKDLFDGVKAKNIKFINGRQDSGVGFYREFMEDMESGGTLYGALKIAIIDEAHALTPQALETFLSALEKKDNDNLYFILCTTESVKIPKSLESRTTKFRVKRPDDMDLARYLHKVIDEEKWRVPQAFKIEPIFNIIEATDGCVRQCLNILGQMALAGDFSEEYIKDIAEARLPSSYYGILDELLSKGGKGTALMDIERLAGNSSVEEVFKQLFYETLNLYRIKVLQVPLKFKYQEINLNKRFQRVSALRVKVLMDALAEVKRISGQFIDLNLLLYKVSTLTYG